MNSREQVVGIITRIVGKQGICCPMEKADMLYNALLAAGLIAGEEKPMAWMSDTGPVVSLSIADFPAGVTFYPLYRHPAPAPNTAGAAVCPRCGSRNTALYRQDEWGFGKDWMRCEDCFCEWSKGKRNEQKR